jgi:hypothetical protein
MSSYESSVKNAARRAGYDASKLKRAPKSASHKWEYTTPDGKIVKFGAAGYEDYHTHRDPERRRNYMARSGGIAGDWRSNKYSANNLSRRILWPENL